MSLTVTVDSVAITAGMRYPDPNHATWTFAEAAEKGVVGTSGFDMDDPSGAGNLVGLKDVAVDESACTGHTRVFSGFLADRQIGRGMSLVTGPDRQWNAAVVDSNTMLNERIIQSGKRPAETDIARITWLLGSGYLPTVHDHGLIDSGTTTSMPAGDYTGRYPNDVLSDCSNLSNKNFYVTWDDTSAQHTLAYHAGDSTLNESTLRISNVLADVDQTTTFFPSLTDKMRRDPSRVYSGVFFEGNGFHIYRQNLTNGSNFRFRDVRISDSSVGIPASATALADAYLARVGTEEDRMMVCHLEDIPATHVNLIRAGMRIQCKFSHIPGYESFTWLRVVRRVVSSLGQGLYILDLELSNPLLTGFAGGTTPPIPMPTPPYGQPLPYGPCSFTVDLNGWTNYQGTGSFIDGVLTQIGLDNIGYWTPFPPAAAPAIRVHILLDAATTSATLMVYTGSPGSPSDSEWIAVGVSGGQTYLNFTGSSHTPGWGSVLSMWVEMTTGSTRSVAVWRDTETRADAYIITGSGSLTPTGLAVSLGLLGGVDATGNALYTVCAYGPTTGEYVVSVPPLEAANSSRTTFTAPSAYVAHTLMVFVSGLRKAVVETSPAAGTFTLASAPTTGAEIVLTYTAA